jgi:SAM-dependent methyltransferase
MGISRHGAISFLLEGSRRPYSGSVLQLGRQDVNFGAQDLQSWAAARGYRLANGRPVTYRRVTPGVGTGWIDDGTFFSMLGFDEVRSCDAAVVEKPDYVFDLSQPPPPELHNRFDVVFDGGTLEHVFDFPRALAHIHQLLKVGGRVIHSSPASNQVDHGFYSFSPTLFWDYYFVNQYEVNDCLVIAHQADHAQDAAFFRYTLGCLDRCEGEFVADTFGVYNRFMLFFVATKQPQSTAGVPPFQSRYLRAWKAPGYATEPPQQLTFLGEF